MTSKVTVDAHAGWPLEVKRVWTNGETATVIVQPGDVREFHVHSDMGVHVRELVRDANGETLPTEDAA